MAIITYNLCHTQTAGCDILEACGVIQPSGLIRLIGACGTRNNKRTLQVFTNGSNQIPVKLTIYRDKEFGGSWMKIQSATEEKMVDRMSTIEVGCDSNGFAITAINFFAGRRIVTYRGKTLQDKTVTEDPRKMRRFCDMAKKDAVRHERQIRG